MKKIYFFCAILILFVCCAPTKFPWEKYKNVSSVEKFYLSKSELSSIDGLDNITNIEILGISNNEILTNINCLNNLKTIGAQLSIRSNDSSINIVGMNNLETIGGNDFPGGAGDVSTAEGFWRKPGILIHYNDGPVNIYGMKKLDTIRTGFDITSNDGPVEIQMNNLSGIENGFHIESNDAPITIQMDNLKSVEGIFSFIKNENSENIKGFNQLKTIGDKDSIRNKYLSKVKFAGIIDLSLNGLEIMNNDSLKKIEGFNAIEYIAGNLVIKFNDDLEEINGFKNVETIEGDLDISINKSIKKIDGFYRINKIGRMFRFTCEFEVRKEDTNIIAFIQKASRAVKPHYLRDHYNAAVTLGKNTKEEVLEQLRHPNLLISTYRDPLFKLQ